MVAFKHFWEAYPRRVGITAAEREWRKLTEEQGVSPALLVSKAKAYALNVDPRDLRYVPQPAGWLKDGRYEDNDLFTDQVVAERTYLEAAWLKGDVKCLYTRYGEIYKRPVPPDDLSNEELRRWDFDQKRAWIAGKARKILGDNARTKRD